MFTIDTIHTKPLMEAIDAMEKIGGWQNEACADPTIIEKTISALTADVVRESLEAIAYMLGFNLFDPATVWGGDAADSYQLRKILWTDDAYVRTDPPKYCGDYYSTHATFRVEDLEAAKSLAYLLISCEAIGHFIEGFTTDCGWATILYIDGNGMVQAYNE